MKKILFYFCGIYNGGTEIAALNLMKKLDKEKYELLYYYNDKGNSYKEMLERYDKYAKYVDINENIDVNTLIYCTSALDDLDLIKNIKYKNSYFWFHYFWEEQEEFLKIAIKNNYIDKVITVGEYAKRKLETLECLKNQNKVDVIYNIINSEQIIEKSKEPIEIKKEDCITFVTVARFAPIKGYSRVREMVQILMENDIDFRWYIIGKGKNDKEHNEVLKLFENCDNRVQLLGHKENPFPYMKMADYVVLMSTRETFGLVITESKTLGTPCIVSDFDAAYEQIEDGKNGFIINKENISEFKNILNKVLNSSSKMKSYLKSYTYDEDESVKKWENLFLEKH